MKTQVLVAGGGPVGKVVSSMLARQGVATVLVDQERREGRHPKAHAVTCRSMEIFRSLGKGVEEKVANHCPEDREWGCFRYMERLCGEEIAVQDHMKSAAYTTLLKESVTKPVHVSQPLVEDVLSEVVDEAVQQNGLVFVKGKACKSLQQTDRKVTVGIEGSDPITADHVIVCDGANSTLRHTLGVNMTGPGSLQQFMSIHFFSKQLGEALKSRPGMLYFVFNPQVIACIVAHNLTRGEFVVQAPFYPPHQTPADFTPEACLDLIRAAINSNTDLPTDIEVKAAHPWLMAAQIAEKFQIGRCFIAGDAAHRFPPAGGLGLNTGLQDAQNLAWKLAAVHTEKASDKLLETYEIERKAADRYLLGVALSCFEKGMRVPEEMWMSNHTVRTWEQSCSKLPFGGSAVFNKVLDLGKNLTRLGPYKKTSIKKLVDTWATIPLFFSHDDLGVSYAGLKTHAIVPHEKHKPANPPLVDGLSQYVPSIAPGVRMPSIHYNSDMRYELGIAGSGWTLLTRHPLSKSKVAPVVNYHHIHVTSSPDWDALAPSVQAALVRPDGYTAWVSDEPATPPTINAVLSRILRD
eukprot:TRINITY_DN20086_c0_g1_i1.p1 TRINITY_DN20086_c0_g1~~TRINITY_DN20086_c0_g1_i1.p1  ORF type:complete len:588 (+),score=136.88 TRINITY_DN20086_c0_g1_i1:36-1766(+)